MKAAVALLLAALASPASAEPSLYEQGDSLRRAGKPAEAKAKFLEMLAKDPESGGALEGLTLSCLALREYDDALSYAWRWQKQKPDSAYVTGFEERALRGLHRHEEALDAGIRGVRQDPCDARLQRRVDAETRERRPGLSGRAKIYKSIGFEDLNSPRPQRIVYEGRSGEARGRARLARGLFAIGGVEVSQEAQRNDSRGFVYYDVLEETGWLGLESRPNEDLLFWGEHGQSLMYDLQGTGVGRRPFSRVRGGAAWHGDRAEASVRVDRAPRFLRGAGGSSFFGVLREQSARADLSADALGATWLGRAGINDLSEGTTLKTWSLAAVKERGDDLFMPSYSHGQQEFFGAAPDGRLRYAMYERYGARWRRLKDERYRLSASYGWSQYRDGNRQHDLSTDATAWLPWLKDLCGSRPLLASYRYDLEDYAVGAEGYRSNDRRAHTLGGYWRQGWRGSWTTLGYEHSFVKDLRGDWEGRTWVWELEAYRRGSLSVTSEGRFGNSSVRDDFYSGTLRARWTF
jgi:hypothetical protein